MPALPPLHPTVADFVNIRNSSGFYVDKTGLFRNLLETDPGTISSLPLTSRHQFLARPRRFGKTLLVNTLEAWFQGLPPGHRANPDGDTSSLDGMPEGWTMPPWLWEGLDAADWHGTHGWHPVIRLDLSQLGSTDPAGTHAALRDYMEDTVWQWTARGAPWSSAWPVSLLASGPERILRSLIQRLGDAYGRQPVVLVDEYDAPITEHLGTDADPTPAVDALRRFFRVLKDDEGLLYGVFVTGITRFARRHLFSAANNFVDISDEPRHGALCGFHRRGGGPGSGPLPGGPGGQGTAPGAQRHSGRMAGFLQRLPLLGLAFGTARLQPLHADQWSVPRARGAGPDSRGGGRCLALRLERIGPSGSGRPPGGRHAQPPAGGCGQGGLPPLPAAGTGTLARPDYVRLMLDTGYYTWYGGSDGTPAHLNFPNREVAESWVRDIFGVWHDADRKADGGLVRTLRTCLAQGDAEGFAQHLEDFAFGLAYENLQNEACFRILLQALFLQMGSPTQSEKSNWGGRADHEFKSTTACTSSRSSTTGPRTQPSARSGIGSTGAHTWGLAARQRPLALPSVGT